jgi:putative transcriptional regulator
MSTAEIELTGDLIVATPRLAQTEFDQAVVLIMQQNESGTFGVVLNRPAGEPVKRLWRTMTGYPRSEAEDHIALGGPLSGPVFALHQDADCSEQKSDCGLYFAITPHNLKKLAVRATLPYKIFFGAVAWQNGQLERELEDGVWVRCGGKKDLIFADPTFQWELALRNYGRELWQSIGIHHFPRDPQLN